MAKKIKFPLTMANNVKVRTLEELKENFLLTRAIEYYANGKLVSWLRSRYNDDIADKIETLDKNDKDLGKKICEILEVEYKQEDNISFQKAVERNEKLDKLKNYSDTEEYYNVLDSIAFTQEDLDNFKRIDKIYLCGDKFVIKEDKKNIQYIKINNPQIISEDNLNKEKAKKLGDYTNTYLDCIMTDEGLNVAEMLYQKITDYIGDNNIKLLEFENIESLELKNTIKNINNKIPSTNRGKDTNRILCKDVISLIYDYNMLNDYGKIILDNAYVNVPYNSVIKGIDDWIYNRNDFKDDETKIKASINFADRCTDNRICRNLEGGFQFIFWSLIVLYVDKTNIEEKLSLICDFACMIGFYDDEVLEIVQAVKFIFQKDTDKLELKNLDLFFKNINKEYLQSQDKNFQLERIKKLLG